MTARLLALSLTACAWTVVATTPASAAAGSSCPPSSRAVTAEQIAAEVVAAGLGTPAVLAEIPAVVDRTDRNDDGVVCQQVGSFGRAQGQPPYFSNFKDNGTRATR